LRRSCRLSLRSNHISIFLIDVGCNLVISKHYKSAVIHRIISDNRNQTSCTAVVVRELDGLSTNARGLAKLFRAHVGNNVIFCYHEHASGFIQSPMPAFVEPVDAVLSGNEVTSSSCSLFVQHMLQVAEEKEKRLPSGSFCHLCLPQSDKVPATATIR